jgi:hypothetical protein
MESNQSYSRWLNRGLRLAVVLPLLLVAVGCNFSAKEADNGSSPSLQQTQMALGVAQTLQAQSANGANATIAAQQATIAAQSVQVTQAVVQAALQPTAQPEQAATQAPAEAPAPLPTEPPVVPATPVVPAPSAANIKEQMKTASVLLYEDMVGDPTQTRFVKKTLDGMGIPYKDDGNAVGWLKSDLLGSAPNGKPWDLVIMAIEMRGDVSGEYFDYLNDVLNKGTSVILEAWHLDEISQGSIGTILSQCGVVVSQYTPKTMTVNDVILWPLPGMSTNPLLSNPNNATKFTQANDTWISSGDLGSLIALDGTNKNTALLLGTNAQEPYKKGTLATCMGGQLILQTFSSHSFPYSVVGPLWQNYITNALQKRFMSGN